MAIALSSSSNGNGSRGWDKICLAGVAVGGVCVGAAYMYGFLKKEKKKPARSDEATSPYKPTSVTNSTDLGDWNRLKTLGNQCYASENYALAITYYSTAIELCPTNEVKALAIFHQNRAAAYQKLADEENVFNDCCVAVQLDPKYEKARRLRAGAAMNLKKYEIALQDYVAICLTHDFEEEFLTLALGAAKELANEQMKIIFSKRGDSIFPLSPTMVDEFFASFAADPIFCEFLPSIKGSKHGNYALSGYSKALMAIKEKRYDNVLDACFEEISKKTSNYLTECLLIRGTFFILLGLPSKAKADLKSVERILNEKSTPQKCYKSIKCNVYIKLALIEWQDENFPRVQELLLQAMNIDDKNPDIYFTFATLMVQLKSFEDAADLYQKAVSLKPDFMLFRVSQIQFNAFAKGEELMNERLIDKMRMELVRLADSYPMSIHAQIACCKLFCDIGTIELALGYIKRAMLLSPNNADLLVKMSALHLRQDDEEGLKLLQLAMKIDPYYVPALKTMCGYYLQKQDLESVKHWHAKTLDAILTKDDMRRFIEQQEMAIAQLTFLDQAE